MRTYDAFGYYFSDRSAHLELSVPDLSYDFSRLTNISHEGRNGLVLCFKRSGTDPGHVLTNPNLHFRTIYIPDLERVTKLEGVDTISEVDLINPIYVFTFHDATPTHFATIERMCYDILLSSNPETAYIPINKTFEEDGIGIESPKEKDVIPARKGFGGIKKI